ncbi:hypothetical protein GCK72_018097 [Caenorhabditis remanei]|uniref:Aminotransferase class I/classII large domain-containing protein n=1 Tax=Caenorhabditis remanei TaxID=31234 RepID=A0A6A5GA34_CAERE|nr:hypothetical protein GCK72_018097 [Caenorhabditis remanei]KAF1751543.1 hypothetical protein GCK72_018097 [Caenorhabditis remanei]
MESSTRSRPPSSANSTLFNRSSDNIIDLEFRHPVLIETSEKTDQKQNGTNGTRRRFADLRKKVSTTTKTSVTETEKVTTTRRSSSAHSTSSRRSYGKPVVNTLYYRKFVDEETKGGDEDSSDSGSVVIHRDSVTRRSRSADHLQKSSSPTMSPIAPPRKRLGREESLHYYRDDEEVIGEKVESEQKRRVTVKSPEPGNTSVSMNDTVEGRNITAGITSVSMNDTCTDTSYESRFSTIPRARSSPPTTHRVNHIHVNVIGPIRTPESERRHKVAGRVGEDITMDIYIERRHSAVDSRRGSHVSHGSAAEAPPKPPRRSKYEENIRIGEPIATSTPMTTIERKQTREERVSTESGESSRKSTRSARPPDINIIECETFLRETRSPARTPATPIVVINQTPSSRRGSQDLLGEPGQRRRKSTVTDIDWYAAFNMKDPSSPTKPVRPPFVSHADERKASRDVMRRRASDSSMIGLPPADIDLNQIFVCTAPYEIKKEEKCQCNACRLIRMSEVERESRIERASRSRQSRSFTRMTEYETRASTLPSRYRTSPVTIELEDIFNPKPSSPPAINTKPPTPPARRRHAPTSPTPPPSQSSFVDEPSPLPPSRHLVTSTIDRKQVTPVTTNSRDSGSQLHENTRNQLLNSPDDWVGQMMNDANEWENRVISRKSSVLSTSSSTARKVSVARRISVDELRKPEKRKSREAVPLPPSDVSIDDIFTALNPKRQEVPKNTEKKTFIVTRKQRAQDVDVIDFEKDRKSPVAPPRSRSTGRTHTSEATITMGGTTETQDKEDKKIKQRVKDFSEELIRDEKFIDKKSDIRNTEGSTDKVFKPSSVEIEIPLNEEPVTSTASIKMRPSEDKEERLRQVESPVPSDHVAPGNVESEKKENRTSAVSIDLDKVFVEGSIRKSDNDVSDERIRRGIEEFEKVKQEKEAQRSGVVVTTHSGKQRFDQSDISMDDVFNTSQQKHQTSHEIQRPEQAESTTVVSSDKPTESASFNLDNVFVTTDSRKPEDDEEERHIQRRIEEFKKTEEEKKAQRTTESISSSHHRIFDDSKISMDDVFSSSKPEQEDSAERSKPDAETSTATASAESKESASINLEGVFITERNKKAEEVDEEEHIRRRIEEFKRAEEEKKIQRATESHSSSHIIFDESNISMDDVFNVSQTERDSSTVNKKPTEEEEEDQRIQERIEEFRRTETEKESQRTTETHASHRIYDDSNVSMDDVFGSENKTDEITVPKEEPKETLTSSITMRPPDAKTTEVSTPTTEPEKENSRTSAVSIDLDKVFVEGSIRKSDDDVSDEKIRRGIEEFERAKQEKEAQRSGVVVTTHSSKHLFDESDISMDEVFNTSRPSQDSTVEVERPTQTESVNIVLNDESIEREERHIRERIEEFERAEEEKKIQRTIEPHSSHHFETGMQKSQIPMEDVFNADNKEVEVVIPLKDSSDDTASDEEAARSEVSASKPVTFSEDVDTDDKKEEHRKSAVSIDLDKVFVEGSAGKSDNDVSDERIRRGIEEFEKAKQEKEAQRSGVVVTTHSSKHLFDQSDISMDDVFNTSRSQDDSTTDKPEDREEEHILERIEEFQQAEEEKQTQRSIEPHSSHQSIEVELDQSSISMDEVFSSENKETEIAIPLQGSTDNEAREPSEDDNSTPSNSSPVASKGIDEKHTEKRKSSVCIDLDKVFVEGSASKSSNDVSDEKIRRGIVEFERARQEKEAQRSGVVVTTHSSKHLFDESDISMDDVFNISRSGQHSTVKVERPEQTESATITLKEEQINQEEKHIRERIEEFQQAEEEKNIQRTTEDNVSHEHFKSDLSESNISMDDVFNTSQQTHIPSSEISSSYYNISEEVNSPEVKSNTSKKFDESNVSTDDVYGATVSNVKMSEDENTTLSYSLDDPKIDVTTDEEETTRNKTTTRTETETDSSTRRYYRTDQPSSSTGNVISTGTIQLDNTDGAEKNNDDSVTSTAFFNLDDIFVKGVGTSRKEDDEKKIQRGIEEFQRANREKESQRSLISEPSHSRKITFDDSSISLDDVFNSTKMKDTEHSHDEPVITSSSSIRMIPSEERVRDDPSRPQPENTENKKEGNRTYAVSIDLDKVFVEGSAGKSSNDASDEKIRRGIEEFEKAKQEKEAQRSGVVVTTHSSKHLFDESDISMDDVFNISQPDQHSTVKVESPEQTGSDNIIFKDRQIDQEEKHIQERIEEFQKAEEEKKIQRTTDDHDSHEHFESDFNESNISMDDVFNTSISRQNLSAHRSHKSLAPTPEKPGNSAGLTMDSVSVPSGSLQSDEAHDEEKHIRQRIEEFEEEKKIQRTVEPHSPIHHHIFEESNISMEDVFNISQQKPENEIDEEGKHIQRRIEEFKKAEEEKKAQMTTESHSSSRHRIFDDSNISMDDVFNTSSSSRQGYTSQMSTTPGFIKTTFDSEKTTTTTATRTETTSDSYSKKTITSLDDLFGPQTATPPVISISAISLDPSNQPSSSPTAPPRKHQNLSSLLVPGKWNESMMSNASTISLDDSFNNSFVKSGNSTVYEPKLRKPLSLPVDNWIDNMVSTMTDEATKEAPKTPKTPMTPAENYYRSPTRISQEIKYEWVAKLIEDDEDKKKTEEKEGDQSEEEHLQKQDNTWVSSVVYRPTLETSAYTLRASQLEPEHKREDIDMDRVFDECLMGKKKDDEICECSACRLTEQELEELKKRKIENENKAREERQSVQYETRHVTVTNPSDISIDDVFNPEVQLSIQTDHVQVPSTSSPPIQSTRTYYISPKVSETVTTTHQWKDADISMDEIFSPVSSTTNENRRFSNFYEDRSGWDTIGSEDSGVMSGGDRGRRRSTRITDHVIDEAFKGIFDSQPTTSSAIIKLEEPSAQYDDYYITSLHQDEVDRSDSDVDGDNLDVSQFVDDILGKSLDEAAFLSSTKSLRDYTDTSIDRKKSGDRVHPYYRTRTDTSIDRRVKPAVINEDLETIEHHSNDEIMKLVFVDPNDPSISKSESRRSLSLPRNKSITKPSDEELLEIEIKPEYFIIKGSYSLLIPKSDPLGLMLQKLREQNDSLATLDFSLTRKLKKLLVDCIRERAGCLDMTSASSKYEGLLSSRGQSLIESIDYASATFLKMNVDKYEPTRNPNGVVNFCTAENNICTPLLEERFKHLELFFPNTEHLVRYPPSGGWPEAREVLVKYFKEFMGARVTVDELALTPSTRTGYDVTSYCLFEQDDILLTNGPVYAGTVSNVQEKAQCQVACVETDLSNPRLDVKMYEEELNRQIALENTVSGVIIVNPHNPLGVTFPPEEVVNLCNWAASKNLHVVIDEVFANCVFDKSNSKFRPFLSYRHRVHRPENVAWLWSVSKDFGLPGLKFAVIHSANKGLRQAATKLQMYYPCSPFVQDFAINLLSDSEWLREFHTEVNRRISIHYRYTTENLERLEIPFVPAQAGIFVFADFSKHLSSNNSAGELELFDRIASAGVMLTPGVHQKCHVFGWFRIVFACTKEELEEGFRRLFVHLGSHLHPIGTVHYDN